MQKSKIQPEAGLRRGEGVGEAGATGTVTLAKRPRSGDLSSIPGTKPAGAPPRESWGFVEKKWPRAQLGVWGKIKSKFAERPQPRMRLRAAPGVPTVSGQNVFC